MKKLIYAFSAMVLLFASCSSDSESTTTNMPSNLPTKMIEDYIWQGNIVDKVTRNFVYNGNKLVEMTYEGDHAPYKEVFTYTGDLITKIEYFENDDLYQVEEFQYDGQGRLTLSQKFEGEALDVLNEQNTYIYNADGTFIRNRTNDFVDSTDKFYIVNGEISKIESIQNGEVYAPSTQLITYDAKNNPFKNIVGFAKIYGLSDELAMQGFQSNIVMKDRPEGVFDIHNVYEYVYNANNYPTTMVRNPNDEEVLNVQYFY